MMTGARTIGSPGMWLTAAGSRTTSGTIKVGAIDWMGLFTRTTAVLDPPPPPHTHTHTQRYSLLLCEVWDSNLVIFPDRWSGDPCLCAWGGEGHVYSNNTCITMNDSPQGFDSSVSGNTCSVNYTDPSAAPFLPTAHLNTYHTPDGTFFEGCAAPYYTLASLQAVGQELGSAVIKGYDTDALVAQARNMLLG
jgi:hypothetical protein